jgi:hypothetical protein
MVESDIALLYIRSHVWGVIYTVGPSVATVQTHQRPFPCDDNGLSMHMAPRAIRIVVVPTGMTVLLGLHNPPHRWTGTVCPSLPSFTIAPCVNSLLHYRID